jgi:hypothetical protein
MCHWFGPWRRTERTEKAIDAPTAIRVGALLFVMIARPRAERLT